MMSNAKLLNKVVKHEGPLNEMAFAERHGFLRHFVVQHQGASNRVVYGNKMLTINVFTLFLFCILCK